MKVTYTAKRSLVNGHTANLTYDLDILVQGDDPAREAKVEVAESLSGQRETLRFHAVERFTINTFPLNSFDYLKLKEFLDSVEGGNSFTFDRYGFTGRPVQSFPGVLEQPTYTETRAVELGTGGQDDYFSVQFTIRSVFA